MKSEALNVWTLLAEELAPEALQQLKGGSTGTIGIGSTPHDLVTPAGGNEPYDCQDPTKD